MDILAEELLEMVALRENHQDLAAGSPVRAAAVDAGQQIGPKYAAAAPRSTSARSEFGWVSDGPSQPDYYYPG